MIKSIPKEIYAECSNCESFTKHEVLKGRIGKNSIEGIFCCNDCHYTTATTLQIPGNIKIPVIISNGSISKMDSTEVKKGKIISVGDEFFLKNNRRLRVCSLDLGNGQRKKIARTEDIKTIWTQQFDIIPLKITINDNRKSYSRRVNAEPDDKFLIGQILTLSDMECYIHAIKSRENIIFRGTIEARDIVRIYGKIKQWTNVQPYQ